MFEQLTAALKETFKDEVVSTAVYKDEFTAMVKKSAIKHVCNYVKFQQGFNYCADICGTDRFTEEDRFEVVYNLLNLATKTRIRLKVWVDETDLHVPSVVEVWPAANWHERETFDMYGVIFDGHPDLRRMYMPEDFEYFPMRKDYPLIGVPGSIPLPTIDPKAQSQRQGERYNSGDTV